MKFSVYIALSVDGYIARVDGGVDWLDTYGKHDVEMGEDGDMGFTAFMDTVDCMVMGRGCMEAISGFDLAPEQWPYGDTRVIVLSKSLTELPDNIRKHAELYSGSLPQLVEMLRQDEHRRIYVDGGKTIQSFLNMKLITDMCLTRVPVILGAGIPLFGQTDQDIRLEKPEARVFANELVQLRYDVSYE